MQKDQKIFQAHLPKLPSKSNFNEPSGSRLHISGVCEIQRDLFERPNRWEIWMRNEKDIQILQRPGQWYIRKVSIIIATMAICLLSISVWLIILRRQVHKQTQAVREREKSLELRYRELFENAHDIIFSIDLEGRILSINNAGEQTFGYEIEKLQAMSLNELVVKEEQDKIVQLLNDAKMAGMGDHFELMLQTKEKQLIFIELKYRPEVRDGTVIGQRCIARDVTARKIAEMALSQSERQLRHLLADREKLSRDLHDDIIQSIYGIGLGLEECRRFMSKDNAPLFAKLNLIRNQLNQLIRNIRRFLVGQTPDILSQGLTKALETLVVRMNETHPMRCILDVDPSIPDELNIEQSTQVLHIAQEAMSNSLKHSKAQTAYINLSKTDNMIKIEIKDDGCGFSPESLPYLGYGLKNMESRTAELKGRFRLNSFPGKGTKIVVEFPAGQSS
jgi:PAS domain S-box-containing protein